LFYITNFHEIEKHLKRKTNMRQVLIDNEAGALNRPDKGQSRVIDTGIVEKERRGGFEISRADRFRYRTRYFTDAGIIGTREFVSDNYRRFKDLFMSRREKIPRPVAGLDGVYSLKRLAEGPAVR
jgi:hypothetical protein